VAAAGDSGGGDGGGGGCGGGGGGCWVHDTVFLGASHSVHNTRQEAFVAALNTVALAGGAAPAEV